jgi:hypothetical protein
VTPKMLFPWAASGMRGIGVVEAMARNAGGEDGVDVRIWEI